MNVHRMLIAILLMAATHASARAAEEEPAGEDKGDRAALYKQFEETLTGAKLRGHFTVIGKEDKTPREESYTISSVTKLDAGDYWLFKARIKYGGKDVTVPVPIEVKWAGDTPLITLTDLTIPGLGTFSSRVVIYKGRYAGTWTHGEVGGHLYGVIEKAQADELPEEKPEPK